MTLSGSSPSVYAVQRMTLPDSHPVDAAEQLQVDLLIRNMSCNGS